jgi:hypothetical protein
MVPDCAGSAPTCRDDKARGEPLHLPFKGCAQGLVEIVDIEDEVSFGRGEAAEIHQMTVAAGMNIYPACRCILEIMRLYQGRPSKIRKWRLEAFAHGEWESDSRAGLH